MEKFKTYVKEAMVNPQSNLTKKQRQALASPAARAKPKDKVTLAVPPWAKKKKETDEGYGMPPKAAAHKARMDAKFGKVTTLKKGDPRIKAIQDVQKRKEKAFNDLSKKESVEVNESTNWKGGSKHIGLTKYAAKQGMGVQISQAEPMPGQQKRFKGANVSVPIKDIPKICKALMNVYKSPANSQLGDAD